MIHCMLQGGLGNQMFEYACARKLQIELQDTMELHTSGYKYDSLREYRLCGYKLNSKVTVTDSFFPFFYDEYNNYLFKIIRRASGKLLYYFYNLFGGYFWFNNSYLPIKLHRHKWGKDIYLSGYWQSPIYFDSIREVLIHDFTIEKQLNDTELLLKERIIETENAICIHVRRGDFVNTIHQVCNINYYNNAISLMTKNILNLTFYIFSDDLAWAKENIDFNGTNVIFVDNISEDYIELFLMSLCKHFIISNSSFSWWAQYLCSNQEKRVYAPKRWYANNQICELYNEKWILIGSEEYISGNKV